MSLRRNLTRLALAAAVGGSLLLAAVSRAATDMPMDSMVSGASSKADHEKLAKRYDEEAATARSTSEMHQRMAERYQRGSGVGIGKAQGTALEALARHCRSLAERYKAVAEDYAALAAMERELATQM